MTFSGCKAATGLLERCFILRDFKIYNVFLPMNVSILYINDLFDVQDLYLKLEKEQISIPKVVYKSGE